MEEPAPTQFTTTRWSLVSASRDCDLASNQLCHAYWAPLYGYACRRGLRPHDAEDLVQQFFHKLIASQTLQKADQNRGKLRTFLLTLLRNQIANHQRDARSQKRGGALPHVAIDSEEWTPEDDADAAESHHEAYFHRAWAIATLNEAQSQLGQEYASAQKSDLFDALSPVLRNEPITQPLNDLAATLNVSVGSLRVATHRLRRRYGELIRQQISHTVNDPADIDSEVRFLVQILAGGK